MSDPIPVSYKLPPETLEQLRAAAEERRLLLRGHGRTGRPNVTQAIVRLAAEESRRLERRRKARSPVS